MRCCRAGTAASSAARRLGLRRDALTSLVRVSYLAPTIVDAILDGRGTIGLGVKRMTKLCRDLPHDWTAQRAFLGFDPA